VPTHDTTHTTPDDAREQTNEPLTVAASTADRGAAPAPPSLGRQVSLRRILHVLPREVRRGREGVKRRKRKIIESR